MSTIDDGGPAFPIPDQQFTDGVTIVSSQGHPGLSLRDFFAGQVAMGMAAFSGSAGTAYGPIAIAMRSYEIADAMLAARKVQS